MSDPAMIEKDHEGRFDPGHGEMPHRHFVEAQILQSWASTTFDESESADPRRRGVPRRQVRIHVPFVCGCRNLARPRRIGEGAAMIRTKGRSRTGNIVEAVRHMRSVISGIRRLTQLAPERDDDRGQESRGAY